MSVGGIERRKNTSVWGDYIGVLFLEKVIGSWKTVITCLGRLRCGEELRWTEVGRPGDELGLTQCVG